jgi:hypothetical protein
LANQNRFSVGAALGRPSWVPTPQEIGLLNSEDHRNWNLKEKNVNTQNATSNQVPQQKMIPMVLSITVNLLLWTLGLATMSLAHTENEPQRVVQKFQIDRSRVENLQRWVNSGHDTWCRSGELVAQATLQRFALESSVLDVELASLPTETDQVGPDKTIYTYHSLDGRITYRITVVRCTWLLKSTASKDTLVWVPIRTERIAEKSDAEQPSEQHSTI